MMTINFLWVVLNEGPTRVAHRTTNMRSTMCGLTLGPLPRVVTAGYLKCKKCMDASDIGRVGVGSERELTLPDSIWIVQGSLGEYEDRDEWPVAAYATEAEAEQAVADLLVAARNLYAVFKARSLELTDAGDRYGETLLDTTEEGRVWAALHGRQLSPGQYDFRNVVFIFYAIPFRS